MGNHKPIIYDNPDFIYTADPHIRDTIPKCRTDDFLLAQENKWRFIFNLSEKYKCPIIVGGDLGHKAEWKNWLLSWFMLLRDKTDQPIYLIPGQHDLPYHELDKWIHSGIGVLNFSNVIEVWDDQPLEFLSNSINKIENCKLKIRILPCPYGEKILSIKKSRNQYIRNILVTHRMVIDKPLWPGQIARTGYYFLKKYPMYDAILSGDNHQPFVHRYKNRILVNPGSLMRTTTEQINHNPRVYLYYANTNTICPVYIPIEKNVINKEHIVEKNDREKRIKSYITYIDKLKHKKKFPVVLSFKRNIDNYLKKSKHKKPVKKLVIKHTQEK